MTNGPDYSVYHKRELEAALAAIDEQARPEEARRIRDYLEKGGYAYPAEATIQGVSFRSGIYKWSLITLLVLLLMVNLLFLLASGSLFALIPIAVQSGLLLAIANGHKYTRGLIKLWSGLLILSALFGFASQMYAPMLNPPLLIEFGVRLCIGLVFLGLANRCVQRVTAETESAAGAGENGGSVAT